MFHHLFKLPLYILALPFFILTAVGRGGLCAVSGGGRLWGRNSHFARSPQHARHPGPPPVVKVPVADMSATPAAPQRRHASFGPGLALAAGAALLTMAVVHFRQANVVSGIEVPSVSEFELNRLIDRVTGQRLPHRHGQLSPTTMFVDRVNGPEQPPIRVAIVSPPENGEDLPPGETKLGATEKPATEDPSFVVFDGTEPMGRDADALPDWAEETELTTFPGLSGVIKTGPNATQEDAEREALLTLRQSLSEWFGHHESSAAGWLPPEEIVLDSGVVLERAIEQTKLAVGEFEEPVFTAYWHITEPEKLDSQLFAAWRPEALKSRLWLFGGGMGLLTLLFGSMATYFRVDEATHGKYRNKLRVGTGALWALIAGGSAMMFVS
ncbi:MAG: hypothetical protein KDA52_04895 [Planctomycetaceae bacterium]|nr:hypothetical protein [Planctomycetaceae bacterium]